MQKPGKTNLPADLTSFVAVAARLEIIWPATFCLSSNSSAGLSDGALGHDLAGPCLHGLHWRHD